MAAWELQDSSRLLNLGRNFQETGPVLRAKDTTFPLFFFFSIMYRKIFLNKSLSFSFKKIIGQQILDLQLKKCSVLKVTASREKKSIGILIFGFLFAFLRLKITLKFLLKNLGNKTALCLMGQVSAEPQSGC